MYCSKCGTQNSEGDAYCRKCGLPINQTTQPPTSPGNSMSSKTPKSYLPDSISDKLPSMVKVELVKMSPEQQALFVEEYRRKKKSTGVAYLLWFFFGLYWIYLGKIGWWFVYFLTLGGLGIWAFVNPFLIPSMVRNYNKDKAMDVFRDLKMTST